MKAPKANSIVNGIAILKDFDKKMYKMKPAPTQAIAVRVPDGNMPHMHKIPMNKKIYLNFFIFDVIPKIIKATPVDAIAMP